MRFQNVRLDRVGTGPLRLGTRMMQAVPGAHYPQQRNHHEEPCDQAYPVGALHGVRHRRSGNSPDTAGPSPPAPEEFPRSR